jgi:hypothetical protein
MAFKKTTQQVVVEKRTVFIGSLQEAFQILDDYNKTIGAVFLRKYGCTYDEAQVLCYAAASYILTFQAGQTARNRDLFTELGVNRVPDSPAEPVWVSQDGSCTRVRELPTRHLINIVNKYDRGNAAGMGIIAAC